MDRSKRSAAFATGVIFVIYIALRCWRLTASCLWFDEIFGVDAARHSWYTILNFVAVDLIHPPLFYILLKFWIALVGESVVCLRALPVIFACLAVLPFLMVCRELKLSAWTRNIAFLMIAVNGSLIKYSQELRMYSLLMFISTTSIWLFARYFVKGKSFTPLLIVNILLVYTHYFGWLVIITEVFAIGWLQRVKLRRMLLQPAIIAAAFLPWGLAVAFASQNGSDLGQNIGWMDRPGIASIAAFAVNLIEPVYSQMNSGEPVSRYIISLPLLFVVAAIIIFSSLYRPPTASIDAGGRSLSLAALFAFFPVIFALAVSWLLPYSVWGTRHLIIVFIPAALLVGLAADRLAFNWLRTAFVGAVIVLAIFSFSIEINRAEPNNIWCAWGPLAERSVELGAEKIYVFEDLAAYHAWFELRDRAGRPFDLIKIKGIDGMVEDKAYFFPRGRNDLTEVTAESINGTPVWLLFRGPRVDANSPPLTAFISRGYKIAQKEVYAARTENAYLIKLEK